ncbi:MAG: hypothetical protein KA419_05030 [Acidobacteria bacterium]|nr:hypothetical protein [Acidobacteriota bacterium]
MFGITMPSTFTPPVHPPGPWKPGAPVPPAPRSPQPGAAAAVPGAHRPEKPVTPGETVQRMTNPTTCLPGSPASAALRRTGPALLLLMLLLVFSGDGVPAQAPEPGKASVVRPEAIPMEKGVCWVYSGQVEWLGRDQKEHRKVLKWRSEITDVVQSGGMIAATLLGHPLDLAFYEEGREPGRYVLVKDTSGKYYLLSNTAAEAFVNAMIQGESPRAPSVEDMILDGAHPMSAALASPTDDGYNRWVTDGARNFILKGIKGLQGGTASSWRMSHRTNSSHMMASYVPGVGLVAFLFGHHGTLSRVDVRLSEFTRSGPGPVIPAPGK